MTPNWKAIRATYPALRGWTYLNTATYGLLSEQTTSAVAGHFARRDEFACADHVQWFDDIDRTREKAARLINAQPTDIAFHLNASSVLGLFLGGLEWKKGDRIVTLAHEFPNQIYHASTLSESGVELIVADWEHFHDAVTPATRAVLVSQVNYSTGFKPPLQQIGPWLANKGVHLYVDATQALGAVTLDVELVKPAMVAVHGYKWLLAPNGATFAYVSPEHRKTLKPRVFGWRSHAGWRNVDRLHHGAPVLAGSAEQYEGGMPAFPSLYGLDASLDRFLELGPHAVEHRVRQLTQVLHDRLDELDEPVRILHRDSPITAAVFERRKAEDLAAALQQRRVLTAARHGALRISLHFYNDESDIDSLIEVLRSL